MSPKNFFGLIDHCGHFLGGFVGDRTYVRDMNGDVVGGREAVQHALSDRAGSVKALLDADFTVFDTAELLGLLSEREQYARADAAVDHRILAALIDRAPPVRDRREILERRTGHP